MDQLTSEFIAESQDALERMELCITELERNPHNHETVLEIFRTLHTIKGTTGFLGLDRLQSLAHTGESLLVALRDGRVTLTPDLVSAMLELTDGLREILRLIETTGTEGVRSTDEDSRLIALLNKLRGAEERATGEPAATQRASGSPPEATSVQHRTLRVEVDALNQMMNLVGELVLSRNQIVQSTPATGNFPELSRRLNRVTSELREQMMHLRMQPLGQLFGKYPRMVRDLAQTCGRRVRIELEGQETTLDKTLLEAVRDPLTHAVRNAVDHGIEPPHLRLKAAKPVEGVVRLKAYQQSGAVVIEVVDDGAGISPECVLKKALEVGLVTPEQAETMTEREILQLVFVAGFSTAKQITSISGRGVGLDVVRANVGKVGGSVEIESQPGAGTTLRMRVPLTLAIVSSMIVECASQSFGIPQACVTELLFVPQRETRAAVERVGDAELLRLHEELLPLVRLDRLLGLQDAPSEAAKGIYIVVMEAADLRFGLVVDGLKAPEEIVAKPLSRVLREIGIFSGATMLGNGELALLLDPVAVGIRAGVKNGESEPAASPASNHLAPGSHAPMVICESKGRALGSEGCLTRVALPLSAVERIERVALNALEFIEEGPVLRYAGELLPLRDPHGPLQEAGADGRKFLTVLICRLPGEAAGHRVGVIVQRVLDVAPARILPADPELSERMLVIADGHLASVPPAFAETAYPELRLQAVA